MARISQQTIDRVLENANLADIVRSDGVSLNRGLRGKCPFHSSKDNDLGIAPPKNGAPWLFRCFSGKCGEKGDAVAYVMKRQGLSYRDAVLHLAELCGIEPQYENEERTPEQDAREQLASRKQEALQAVLMIAEEALDTRFCEASDGLAWPDGRFTVLPRADRLIDRLLKLGYGEDVLAEIGLLSGDVAEDPLWSAGGWVACAIEHRYGKKEIRAIAPCGSDGRSTIAIGMNGHRSSGWIGLSSEALRSQAADSYYAVAVDEATYLRLREAGFGGVLFAVGTSHTQLLNALNGDREIILFATPAASSRLSAEQVGVLLSKGGSPVAVAELPVPLSSPDDVLKEAAGSAAERAGSLLDWALELYRRSGGEPGSFGDADAARRVLMVMQTLLASGVRDWEKSLVRAEFEQRTGFPYENAGAWLEQHAPGSERTAPSAEVRPRDIT